MKIYFATDHAGFELKNELLAFVRDELGYDVVDCGAHEFVADDDYPNFVRLAAQHVSTNPEDKAIILGASGEGEAMCANRYSGVRAAVYYGGNEQVLAHTRIDNDANILSLGARFLDYETAKAAVRLWLETSFSEEARHVRRINKIDAEG